VGEGALVEYRRWFVSGRVQGVFFRESTRRKARSLALNGYAHNLDDGRVEVVAAGSSEALAELETWLWQGPTWARVSGVDGGPCQPEDIAVALDGFRTG
jgi:acylphosphatase